MDTQQDAMQSDENIMEITGLKKHFTEGSGLLDLLFGDIDTVHAVDGIDLNIKRGETLGIVGESGCGKSTLGKTLVRLHEPTDGTIEYDGNEIGSLSDKEMRPLRDNIQIIMQDPLASLNPRKTVRDILTVPMKIHGIEDTKEERTRRAIELLEEVGLNESHLNRYPRQFSGGQQQRITIARALAVEPDVLIADEPTSALDVSVQAQIIKLLEELKESYGLTMVFITHDLGVIRKISDRICVMYLGEIVEKSPTEDLFRDPKHPYTRALLSSVPKIEADERSERENLRGVVPSPIEPPTGCRFHTRCPAVIPIDNWSGTQKQFREIFRFAKTIEEETLDTEFVSLELEMADQSTDPEHMTEYILENLLKVNVSDLPNDVAETLEEGVYVYITDGAEAGTEILSDYLQSPCVSETPTFATTGEHRKSNCHRFNPEMPGEPL